MVEKVLIMHSLSFPLDALFQFGLEALCIKGSLTKVIHHLSLTNEYRKHYNSHRDSIIRA